MSDLNEEKNKELDAAGDITEEDTTAAQTNSVDNNAEPETAAAQEVSEEKSEPAEKPVKLKKPGKKPEEIRNGNPAARKLKLNKRNFKHGTLAVVFTVIFIAAVVVLNVIVSMISDRIDTTADLSDTGIYTLDDETIAYLDDLTMDVTVSVMNSETDFEGGGTYYKSVNELLKKMEMQNEHFKVQYLKIDQHPEVTSKYTGETLNTNYIVVEAAETGRHRIITPSSYFTCDTIRNYYSQYGYPEAYIDLYIEQYVNSSYASQVIEGSNIEQAAISAMMFVTNTDPVRVAFTTGLGETQNSNLETMLSKNGYDVESINLMNVTEIDSNIDFIVMMAPTMDYDNDSLDKLAKFLDNDGAFGKNLVYFSSSEVLYERDESLSENQNGTALTNLSAFLAEWGIKIEDSYVLQSNGEYVFTSVEYNPFDYKQVMNVQDTELVGNATNNSLYTCEQRMRPVTQIWGEDKSKGGVEQKVLIKSYDGAYEIPFNADENFDISTANSGVFNDAICAYRIHSTTQEVSRVAVFGSVYFQSLTGNRFNNQNILINMFNYISGKTEGVTITSKSFSTVGFDMNQGSANVLAVILCIVVPVVVIVLGIVIWVRRRHR